MTILFTSVFVVVLCMLAEEAVAGRKHVRAVSSLCGISLLTPTLIATSTFPSVALE